MYRLLIITPGTTVESSKGMPLVWEKSEFLLLSCLCSSLHSFIGQVSLHSRNVPSPILTMPLFGSLAF